MAEDLSHYIPRTLDDPGKFLFWRKEVAAIGLMGLFIGVAIGFPLLGMVAGGMLAYGYSKLRVGKHPGMTSHLAYWLTGMPALKELPPSYLREFNG